MRNDGVFAKIRQVPKSLLQQKSGKIGQNVILQKVLSILKILVLKADPSTRLMAGLRVLICFSILAQSTPFSFFVKLFSKLDCDVIFFKDSF